MHWAFVWTGFIFWLVIIGFAVSSYVERERRAAGLVVLFATVFAGAWFGVGGLWPRLTLGIAVSVWTGGLLGVLFLSLPLGGSGSLDVDHSLAERFDERHIMFGRMELQPGTPQYETYYTKLNPDMKAFDDKVRSMPRLGEEGGQYAHALDSAYFRAVFDFIEKWNHLADPGIARPDRGIPRQSPVPISPEEATRRIKGFGRYLGALDVRVTKLKAHHVYSHAGRRLHNWGKPIEVKHKYAIVLSVEMDHAMVQSAPLPTSTTETAVEYMRAANIAICLARYITEIGYPARAHVDGNYEVLTTAVAHEAGIGELGRLGLIITPSHGPRVRLAVVTTDLPLEEDGPVHFGVQHFCRICKKCAENCPSQSIERMGKKNIRGVLKWQSQMESCYRYWRKAGTDCAVCVAVCPYSKPRSVYHNLMRFFCKQNGLARRLAYIMDDLLYTRRPRHTHKPPWFSQGA